MCEALAALPQSSLVAMTDWSEERTRVSVGFASAFAIPKLASDGPATLITTVFGVEPPMMNPAIITSLPVSTCMRVEILARRGVFAALNAVNANEAAMGTSVGEPKQFEFSTAMAESELNPRVYEVFVAVD